MLSFDTNNYDTEIRLFSQEISSLNTHIELIDSLITSLLFDTYTNSTFVASDLNVIRINTSNNYDSIQSISTSKLDLSISNNFASTSTLSNLFSKSDSSNFVLTADFHDSFLSEYSATFSVDSLNFILSSKSTDFALDSNSTLFGMESDTCLLSSSITSLQNEKADKSELSNLESSLTKYLESSLSTDFFLSSNSSDLTSDLASSFSSITNSFSEYTPLTDYDALVSSFTDFTSAVPTSQEFNYHSPFSPDSISNLSGLNVYYLTGTQSDPTSITFSNLNFQSPVNFKSQSLYVQGFNTLNSPTFNSNLIQRADSVKMDILNINGFDICSNTFSGATNFKYLNFTGLNISENSFSSISVCINGYSDFVSNTFNSSNTISVNVLNNIISNSFSNNSFISLSCLSKFSSNSIASAWKSVNLTASTFSENTFSKLGSLYVDASSQFYKNSLESVNTFYFQGHNSVYFNSNTVKTCNMMSISNYYVYSNSFSDVYDITIDFRDDYRGSVMYNTFSGVFWLNIYMGKSTSRPLYFWKNSFPQYNYCKVNIIAENSNPYEYYEDITKSFCVPSSGIYISNLYFNGRNKFIDSGYVPGKMFFSHINDGVLNTNSYVGSLETISGDLYDWSTGVPVQKWGANFNCLKHYGILYSSSDSTRYHYKDFWEFDGNAVEAGHNNNACENLGIIKNRVSYSTTGFNYTYYQWPSISINVPTAAYNGSTYINANAIWTNISTAMTSKWLGFSYTLATKESNWDSYTRAGYNLEWLSDFSSVFNIFYQNSQYCGTMSFDANVLDG